MMLVEHVSKSFGGRGILRDVSLEVPGKTMITITGKSGSGKSTLLGIMSGLLKPDEGRVLFNGKNIFSWLDFRRSRFRNRKIGFVFQFFNLLPDMTAYQNILYPSLINFSLSSARDDIEYLIDFLDLRNIIRHYPSTLSGGERQRVAIARAIINRPEIILADEPTGNLDDETGGDILKLFQNIKQEYGISFVVATHDQRFVRHADMRYHLHDECLAWIDEKRIIPLKKKSRP